ncbi:response regulator transcription factor [Kitasatospora sp. NPDC058162]|uniref:response regulator transcription factor n=1 Tax=Kitasatospora sp. NPDC058162 TaxID=3346362 RepID=UPI0036D9BCC1
MESDAKAAGTLVHEMRRQGHQAESVDTGTKALHQHRNADLILMDPDLPDLDGIEVCRAIRSVCNTAIIVVTTRDSALERVLGLQAGSDDYVAKPYCFPELLARIDAVMRRVHSQGPVAGDIIIDPLSIILSTREVRLGDRRIDVTRKEFDLLYLLASQPERIISRRQIMTQVWDDSRSQPGRTIDTHVSSLRSKLGSSSWITTVRGVGFRLGQRSPA